METYNIVSMETLNIVSMVSMEGNKLNLGVAEV